MKKILVTVDGSEHSKRAVEKARALAEGYKASITILNVRNIVIPYAAFPDMPKFLSLLQENSQQILDEAKGLLADSNLEVDILSIEGDVAYSIIDYVEDNDDIDLVVMGSQGLGAGKIQNLFIGSITNKVLHEVEKPVLVVR